MCKKDNTMKDDQQRHRARSKGKDLANTRSQGKAEPPQTPPKKSRDDETQFVPPAGPDPADNGLNLIDQAIADSFPASDPPSFMGGPPA